MALLDNIHRFFFLDRKKVLERKHSLAGLPDEQS
jgi:hypothetical protein